MSKALPTFGGHPVPELFTPEETALAERLARELFATAEAPKAAGAPETFTTDHDDIELTGEMISAGMETFWEFSEYWSPSDRSLIIEILRSALRVAPYPARRQLPT